METQPTKDSNAPEINGEESVVFGMKPSTFCVILHLSQLANFWIPPGGIILPIVLWTIGKDKSPKIDQHGKIVLNWLISLLIYTAVGVVVAIPIGHVFFIAFAFLLWIPAFVFPFIGALKANEGTTWSYPLSIRFVK